MNLIFIILGRNVIKKVSNQMVAEL